MRIKGFILSLSLLPSLPLCLLPSHPLYLKNARVVFGLDVLAASGTRKANRAGARAPAPLGNVPTCVLFLLLLLALTRHTQNVVLERHIEVWNQSGREKARVGVRI